MKNIDKEPTYYVSLTEYNEVKRMFLKANDEINKLKDLLKECKTPLEVYNEMFGNKEELLTKIDEALQ